MFPKATARPASPAELDVLKAIREADREIDKLDAAALKVRKRRSAAIAKLISKGWTPAQIGLGAKVSDERVRHVARAAGYRPSSRRANAPWTRG